MAKGEQALNKMPKRSGDHHPWVHHAATYRAKEIQIIANWVLTGASGSLIGIRGSGKSNLLGFLCHRPEVLNRYLPPDAPPVTILPMDLNTLPAPTLSALYRVILRTFYEHRGRFPDSSREEIQTIYLANREYTDPFMAQSAVRELLIHLQLQRHRVVFALDRFDSVSTMLKLGMGDSLRGLRDGFKETLSYLACLNHGFAYLPHPELLGDLRRLLDQQICFVGPMNEDDTRNTIARRVAAAPDKPSAEDIEAIWHLTGGYPSLVLLACRWWLTATEKPPVNEWLDALLQQTSMQHRLDDIWTGLTQEEQMILTEVQKATTVGQPAQQALGQRFRSGLDGLCTKGICQKEQDGWHIFSPLFAEHVAKVGGFSRGKIWLERDSQTLYHGQQALSDLAPKERAILQFLAEQPYARHTYTDLIVAGWTDTENYEGVTTESLFQVVRTLRQKIEPIPSEPVYVINWRGKPEGGYQFFPEGRPN